MTNLRRGPAAVFAILVGVAGIVLGVAYSPGGGRPRPNAAAGTGSAAAMPEPIVSAPPTSAPGITTRATLPPVDEAAQAGPAAAPPGGSRGNIPPGPPNPGTTRTPKGHPVGGLPGGNTPATTDAHPTEVAGDTPTATGPPVELSVVEGEECDEPGRTGLDDENDLLTCGTTATDDTLRWRSSAPGGTPPPHG